MQGQKKISWSSRACCGQACYCEVKLHPTLPGENGCPKGTNENRLRGIDQEQKRKEMEERGPCYAGAGPYPSPHADISYQLLFTRSLTLP